MNSKARSHRQILLLSFYPGSFQILAIQIEQIIPIDDSKSQFIKLSYVAETLLVNLNVFKVVSHHMVNLV
jgi:hypothetical protein